VLRSMKNPAYRTWRGMLGRCYDPVNASYFNYGDKGVKVCRRWWDFDAFVEDMGERPEGKTLDRIDSAGDYRPENCRWATVKEQQRKRKATKLTYEQAVEIRNRRIAGEQGKALAKEFGISQQVVCDIYKGRYWHPDEVK
jgi:hypothetical protein